MDEDEAALLAELRAISNSSASSRFDEKGDGNSPEDSRADHHRQKYETISDTETRQTLSSRESPTALVKVPTSPIPRRRNSAGLSPWKKGLLNNRKRHSSDEEDVIDVVATAASSISSASSVEHHHIVTEKDGVAIISDSYDDESNFRRSDSNIFQGKNGGTAEDPELLALLRGVSVKSSSASRFEEDSLNPRTSSSPTPNQQLPPRSSMPPITMNANNREASPLSRRRRSGGDLPPWKRAGAVTPKSGIDPSIVEVVHAAAQVSDPPPTESIRGFRSDATSTFKGERGGAADDPELLALLRGISVKSSSRFDDSHDQVGEASTIMDLQSVVATTVLDSRPSPSTSRNLVASAAPNRIVDISPSSRRKEQNENLPPWKRSGSNKMTREAVSDVKVPTVADTVSVPNGNAAIGIKSDMPSTFKGDRGGAAEDAELLALLRGISSSSASANRFHADDDQLKSSSRFDDNREEAGEVTTIADLESKKAARPQSSRPGPSASRNSVRNQSVETSPSSRRNARNGSPSSYKRSGAIKMTTEAMSDVQASNVEPIPTDNVAFGIKSDMPSSFKGDRGGAAEDAELLALLRGISSNSSSANRFHGDNEQDHATQTVFFPQNNNNVQRLPLANENAIEENKDDQPAQLKTEFVGSSSMPLADELVESSQLSSVEREKVMGSDESLVSRDNLLDALHDKNWKIRLQAYEFLSSLLEDLSRGRNPGTIDASRIVDGLDARIPGFVEESNASALDKALEFVLLYTDYCRNAGMAEQAAAVVLSLVNKTAFSSRPTTLKLATSLALKLMEVGMEGTSSLHSVVDVLLKQGLQSKKPKVVQAAAAVLVDATIDFGAACLPIASVISTLPSMLSNTNAKVRESAMRILAEICRALGSKQSLQNVISGLKKAQSTELDSMLAEQSAPTPVRVGLRSRKATTRSSTTDPLPATIMINPEELEGQRFAARPAVNLIDALARTEFSSRLALEKWSEKVAALDIALECGGEKPYKLAQPTASINYAPLITEMKKLLAHSHFAVCSKAMHVISMLAGGVGDKLYPNIRPLLTPLLQLSKDKKLTNAVSSCLDSIFGNVLGFDHLMEKDDALPTALDEASQKNALARLSALEFLGKCVARAENAGPRGALGSQSARDMAKLCARKLGDSEASIRKSAIDTLQALQKNSNSEVIEAVSIVIASLKTENPRAYKALAIDPVPGPDKLASSSAPASSRVEVSNSVREEKPAALTRSSTAKPVPSKPLKAGSQNDSRPEVRQPSQPPSSNIDRAGSASNSPLVQNPTLEEALNFVSNLQISKWDAPEDDGGVLAGLGSSKWTLRDDSIKTLISFVESGQLDDVSSDTDANSSSILVVVKEYTKSFKDTNVNIMKSVLLLFMAFCQYHEAKEVKIFSWIAKDGVTICVQKISDRKLSSSCKELLTALCVVVDPMYVISEAIATVKAIKAPVAHEEFLRWFQTFSADFGSSTIGARLAEVIPWIIEEIETPNPKIKKEALALAGLIHKHIGPAFRALSLSLTKKADVKEQLDKAFTENPFDPSSQGTKWRKSTISTRDVTEYTASSRTDQHLALPVPKTDLFSLISVDTIAKLGSKEGKTAWKIRKEALDDVDNALKRCNGLIDTSAQKFSPLAELTRGLRDRLSDTQANLKPVAARIIGILMSMMDKSSQAKIGKIAFSPLLNAAMNDIKKPMRDACLEALRIGSTASPLDGGGLNEEALESLFTVLVSEVNETTAKAGGLPEVLQLVMEIVSTSTALVSLFGKGGHQLSDKYIAVLIECLTSSKSETRGAASSLLEVSVEKGIVAPGNISKTAEKLKPANQRAIAPLLAKYTKANILVPAEKNNVQVLSETENGKKTTGDRKGRMPSPSRPSHNLSTIEADGIVLTKRPSLDSSKRPSEDNFVRHPLVPRSGQAVVRPSRLISWPEYPEEPQGLTLLGSLKKSWSTALPPTALSVLFPNSGIKKQDDAMEGCELLLRGIEIDRSERGSVVIEHIDPILKWSTFVLCSKESTVGLQHLLHLLNTLLLYLVESRYELSDSQSLDIIPFIIDKSSSAKGRFKDVFAEIMALAESEQLSSPKQLGSVVCVAVIERSAHAKARTMAIHTCLQCVEKAGLTVIGKKGVVVAARNLSEETVPESRMASLDLMEAILSRMNGDFQRLTRICGQNLSEKARQLLEERWRKRGSRLSIGSSGSATPAQNPYHLGTLVSESPQGATPIFDELPALSLRNRTGESIKVDASNLQLETSKLAYPASETFSFSPSKQPPIGTFQSETSELEAYRYLNSSFAALNAGSGAAASLRARLLKIREKTVQNMENTEDDFEPLTDDVATSEVATTFNPDEVYHGCLEVIRSLMTKRTPLSEEDPEMMDSIESLKKIHAALAKQTYPAVRMTVVELSGLRLSIASRLDLLVGNVTRMIRFSFDCLDDSINSRLSVPLLSVCLAVLMALFRDSELAIQVSQDDLILLVKETGTALLDWRLSSSSTLDEATTAQMVRAVNKLAVQAATGVARHTSLQALMTLQEQLSLGKLRDVSDEAFTRRLSRVVNKLFARVVKAEEAVVNPYSSTSLDIEALVCGMEDLLVASQRTNSPEAREFCAEMVKMLVASIAKARGGSVVLLNVMEDVGIDTQSSALALAIAGEESKTLPLDSPFESLSYSNASTGKSKDVAILVSNLASAKRGPQRDAALEALRNYKARHGEEDLNEHLQQVSSPFRVFIEEQLAEDIQLEKNENSLSMSERLRHLRSRLQVTEAVVQTAVMEEPRLSPMPIASEADPLQTVSRLPSPSSKPRSSFSRLAQPSPSKIIAPTSRLASSTVTTVTSGTSTTLSSFSLRDRLIQAQESRKVTSDLAGGSSEGGSDTTSSSIGSSMGRAAALRARLEAVKKRGKPNSS